MQSLEAACEEGEVNSFSYYQFNKKPSPQSTAEISVAKPPFCIYTKLRELHEEQCANDPNPFSTVSHIIFIKKKKYVPW